MSHLRRLGLAALLVVASSTFAAGAHAAASAASVERLMQVMKVQQQLDTLYTQTLPAMQNAMRQSMATQLPPAEADRLFNAVMPRVDAVIREELGWAKLKPDFAKMYAETFTQQEIDGLIAFYEGPLGTALVNKLPQLTQRSMALMQQRMPGVMQKAMQVAREEAAKVKPQGNSKR